MNYTATGAVKFDSSTATFSVGTNTNTLTIGDDGQLSTV